MADVALPWGSYRLEASEAFSDVSSDTTATLPETPPSPFGLSPETHRLALPMATLPMQLPTEAAPGEALSQYPEIPGEPSQAPDEPPGVIGTLSQKLFGVRLSSGTESMIELGLGVASLLTGVGGLAFAAFSAVSTYMKTRSLAEAGTAILAFGAFGILGKLGSKLGSLFKLKRAAKPPPAWGAPPKRPSRLGVFWGRLKRSIKEKFLKRFVSGALCGVGIDFFLKDAVLKPSLQWIGLEAPDKLGEQTTPLWKRVTSAALLGGLGASVITPAAGRLKSFYQQKLYPKAVEPALQFIQKRLIQPTHRAGGRAVNFLWQNRAVPVQVGWRAARHAGHQAYRALCWTGRGMASSAQGVHRQVLQPLSDAGGRAAGFLWQHRAVPFRACWQGTTWMGRQAYRGLCWTGRGLVNSAQGVHRRVLQPLSDAGGRAAGFLWQHRAVPFRACWQGTTWVSHHTYRGLCWTGRQAKAATQGLHARYHQWRHKSPPHSQPSPWEDWGQPGRLDQTHDPMRW